MSAKTYLAPTASFVLSVLSIAIFLLGLKGRISQHGRRPPLPNQLEALCKRQIIFIIDALRHDFIDHLPRTKELVAQEKAVFEIFLADPPTTTTQRIISIATGTFQTFWDGLENFYPQENKRDDSFATLLWTAFPQQCYFFGDDTWLHAFPCIKDDRQSVGFPSFDVFDLHSIDREIPALVAGVPDSFKILIVHVLGVDHVGHGYLGDKELIKAKLSEYDSFIETFIEKAGGDGCVTIFGDHGMTEKGEHGGETWNELAAGLIHSDGSGFFEFKARHEAFIRSMQDIRKGILKTSCIPQVDLTATISFLHGIGIPSSCAGSIVPEILISHLTKKFNDTEVVKYLIHATQIAAGEDPTCFSQEQAVDELKGVFLGCFKSSQLVTHGTRVKCSGIRSEYLVASLCLQLLNLLIKEKALLLGLPLGIFFFIGTSFIQTERKIVNFLFICLILFKINRKKSEGSRSKIFLLRSLKYFPIASVLWFAEKAFHSKRIEKISLILSTLSPKILLAVTFLLQRPINRILPSILVDCDLFSNFLLPWQFFYMTDHSHELSSLQWDRCQFAISGYNLIWNASAVFLNAFGIFLNHALTVRDLNELKFVASLEQVKLLCCSVAVIVHSGHLFATAIFLPRWLLQAIVTSIYTIIPLLNINKK